MQTITKYLVLIILGLSVQYVNAQVTTEIDYNVKLLEDRKETIKNSERDALKVEVEEINKRLAKGEITKSEADLLKKEQARKRALNIENRIAIVDNQIELIKRNEYENGVYVNEGGINYLRIGSGDDTNESFIFIGNKEDDKPKYKIRDKRTTSDLVFAVGFNNAIIEGQSLNDSPYKIGGSGFVELGWAWKTRVFKNTNALRLKYGFSFQWNKLDIKDNLYFAETDDVVTLEESAFNLNKSKFRTTNFVVPIHFEFGPSKKIEGENYFRYSTRKKFKIGVGGYGGVVLKSLQKLKYKDDGDRQKDKFKNYNTNNFVYGISSYIAWGDVGIYAKYDLSTIFNDQAIDQNNISLGLRFDMD